MPALSVDQQMQNNNLSICISGPLCHINQRFDMEADVLWEHQRHIDLNRLSGRSQIERMSPWVNCRMQIMPVCIQYLEYKWKVKKKKKDWISFTTLKTVFGIKFTLIICEPKESVNENRMFASRLLRQGKNDAKSLFGSSAPKGCPEICINGPIPWRGKPICHHNKGWQGCACLYLKIIMNNSRLITIWGKPWLSSFQDWK